MLFLMIIYGKVQKLFNRVIAVLSRNCSITCYLVNYFARLLHHKTQKLMTAVAIQNKIDNNPVASHRNRVEMIYVAS